MLCEVWGWFVYGTKETNSTCYFEYFQFKALDLDGDEKESHTHQSILYKVNFPGNKQEILMTIFDIICLFECLYMEQMSYVLYHKQKDFNPSEWELFVIFSVFSVIIQLNQN